MVLYELFYIVSLYDGILRCDTGYVVGQRAGDLTTALLGVHGSLNNEYTHHHRCQYYYYPSHIILVANFAIPIPELPSPLEELESRLMPRAPLP